MLVGSLLYGASSWLTNSFPLTESAQVQLGSGLAVSLSVRPGVAIPIFAGFAFGPAVGFVVGSLGNFLGDLWSGYLAYPPSPPTGSLGMDLVQGFLVNWQIGNGVMGLVPGILAMYHHRYLTWGDQFRALGFMALGIALGMAFASFTDMVIDRLTFQATLNTYFIPAALINLINAAILVPILLYNYQRLDLRSVDWLRSRLMHRLLAVVTVSAALPLVLLGVFLTQHSGQQQMTPTELAVKLSLTVLITLAFTVANAALMAQSLSRRLLRLTEAARLMEAAEFSSEQASELAATDPGGEVGRLSQMFGRMALEVLRREQQLRQQVAELRVEIDQAKKARQVAEITDTEYFQDLQRRAKELRGRTHPSGGS
jgi:uncharacterized membrane protein